jgi:hypothetical protein
VSVISPALSVGAFGDDAASVHERLQTHGYEVSSDEIDRRFFGPGTRTALRQFQIDHDLPPNGLVDGPTGAALAALLVAPAGGPSISSFAGKPIGAIENIRPPGPHLVAPSSALADVASTGDEDGKSNVVHGTLFYPGKSPAGRLNVAAFDQDIDGENRLGSAITDAKGGYRIQYTDAQFRRSRSERRDADIFVRVYAENGDLLRQSETVRNAPADLVLDIAVPEQSFVVCGQVRFADGTPAAGAIVRAHDCDVRRVEPLGKPVTTGEDGRYEICYTAGDFARAEKGRADLRVMVQVEGREPVPGDIVFNAAPNAQVDVTLPWNAHDLSEFEALVQALQPLLANQGENGQDLALFALEESDVDFLTQDTGVPRERIDWLVRAARLARAESIMSASPRTTKSAEPAGRSDQIPAEAFYGWFRLGLPTDANELFALPVDRLVATLRQAQEQRIVPSSVERLLDGLARVIEQIGREHALRAPAPGTTVAFGELLATSPEPPSPEQQAALATALGALRPADPELPARIASIPGFEGDPVPAAGTLWLGALTRGHLPLMSALQGSDAVKNGRKAKTQRDLTPQERYALELRPFAALRLDDWKAMVDRAGVPPGTAGDDPDEQRNNYATSLLGYVEKAIPTAVLASRLANDTSDDSPFAAARQDLTTFFDRNPGFELGQVPLELYLSQDREEKLAGVNDPEALLAQLKNLGRVSRITPHYPEIRALLADDLHSASSMVQLGERRFIERYAEPLGGADQAVAAFRKAEQVHGAAINVYMRYGAGFNSPSPYVITGGETDRLPVIRDWKAYGSDVPAYKPEADQAALANAQWATLFGSVDLCDCGQCKSLYSPAAYFVDVLRFLREPKGLESPLAVLLDRRPDLEHIELTCENSTTPLPYVDLVNEILEAVVVPRTFEVSGLTDVAAVLNDLNHGKLPAAFAEPFTAAGYMLTPKASVRQDTSAVTGPGQAWVILDTGWAFEVRYQRLIWITGFRVAAWPQTSWTADELRANPEHTHQPAYDVLRDTVYPWTLPLSLPVEEARTYLRHLGVPRAEVMEAFFRDPATPVAGRTMLERTLTDQALAREYLGLTAQEADIITGETTRDADPVTGGQTERPWDFWGLAESGNDLANPASAIAPHVTGTWDQVLRDVPVFLQQSGLTYRELLELLGMYFINPATNGTRQLLITAVETDEQGEPVNPATCRLDQLRIDGTDPDIIDAFGRIPRFVRLWRKLGWTARELDQAFTAFAPSSTKDGFEEFLLQISHVRRLQADFDVPVANLLSWWSDIDIAAYIDQMADEPAEASSLYQQVFRNRTVLNPPDAVFTQTGAGLAGTISGHLPALAAALNISAADLARLTTGDDAVVADDTLDLANLSRLYRAASLASALKLTIEEYQTIQRLAGLDPFAPVAATAAAPRIPGTAATLRFVHAVQAIRGSGFSVEELGYLLRHQIVAASTVAPSEHAIGAVLAEMRSELQAIAADNDPGGIAADPAGDLTRRKLALLNWDTAPIEELVTTLNGAVTYEVIIDPLAAAPALPNVDGSYEVPIASRPGGLAFPADLDNSVSIEPKFLFVFDSGTAIESAAGGVVSAALRQKFSDNQVTLPAAAPVAVQAAGTSWMVAGRYSITKTGDVFTVHDQNTLQLRASRFLSQAERDLLTASSTDPAFVTATTDLFQLQDQLQGQVSYEPVVLNGQPKARLRFTGPMTTVRKARLDAVSTDAAYRAGLQELYEAPRKFIARYARSFSVHEFSADLPSMPAVTIPDALKTRVYFVGAGTTGRLRFIGVMTDQQRDTLLALSTDTGYHDAINNLYDQAEPSASGAWVPEAEDLFLTAPTPVGAVDPSSDTARLFDAAATPASRFLLVLRKILPYLRRVSSERLLVQKLADSLGLEAKAAQGLLTTWAHAPKHPAQKAITEFLAAGFAESNSNVPVTAAAFPDQFAAFILLHKISLVIGRLGITAAQLASLFQNGQASGMLDLNALPADPLPTAASSAALFAGWERLVNLFEVRRGLPFGEADLFELFDVALAVIQSNDNTVKSAAKQAWIEQLATDTQWPLADLEVLLGTRTDAQFRGDLGVVFPDGYTDERLVVRLRECFRRMKRLGASAAQASAWGKANPTAAEEVSSATSIKSAAKAKYTDQQWLEVAKPLKDPLRAEQRAALVAYLITHPDPATGRRWRDADELYAHFLVDVQMEPCMTSTRVLQATNSAQLYIQRCLMNLEPGVHLTPDDVQQWTRWRKQYRLWEANRKVLFYPENWIEPELRDDKSPFFEELESELQQNDLTAETAEDVFLHYLEKLEQVGRLEIVGLYRQQEPADHDRNLEPVDIVHVFGRTYAVPHIHFYRRLEKGVWSPWEKVGLDIEGDHLIPMVWNRRLHLFWPTFTEKSEQATKAQRDSNQDPPKYWEIKMAWSEYQNKGWSPKKVSQDWLSQDQHLYPEDPASPANERQEPRDISFKSRISGEQLTIHCYGGKIVKTVLVTEEEPTPVPVPTTTQLLTSTGPHRDDFFHNPIGTVIKVIFTINGARPSAAERPKIRLRIRPVDDVLSETSETVNLNSLGVANSGSDYKSRLLFLDLVTEGYHAVSVVESRSWWEPTNPVDHLNAVVETISENVSDLLQNSQLTQKVADDFLKALDIAVVSVVASGGAAVPAALTAIGIAAAAAGAAVTAALTAALARDHGRRLVVTLEAVPPPPPKTSYKRTTQVTLDRMVPIGDFVLDDCHGDLVRLAAPLDPEDIAAAVQAALSRILSGLGAGQAVAQETAPLALGQLQPLPGTRIENMMFAEFGTGDQAMSVGIDQQRCAPIQLLAATPGRFTLVGPQQDAQFDMGSPFFFQDQHRTYFVSYKDWWDFGVHYHPRVCGLIKTLKREGIPGLLRLPGQQQTDAGAAFYSDYHPVPLYLAPPQYIPREEVDFSRAGAYSLYNWELFFHIPFFIAAQLSKNQRFAEAQKWFHYVFDPTATDSPLRPFMPGPERFWRVQPFYDAALRPVQTLEALIGEAGAIDDQVAAWQANPFKPHVVARMRVVAYMKAVVMRYIDNLIAWGDQLFRQDTIESINEATQLYVLAAQILGKRPEDIPARARPKTQTFRTLDDRQPLDSLSNAVAEIENFLPPSAAPGSVNGTQGGSLLMPFFCITPNDTLLGYWDTVADRLFKIRHCLNIEGVERALPLFQPPIDPSLLVRAAAAGVDITSVLNDLNAAVPHYRFSTMLQKATELCNDVKALGAALLSALEKKDAEELALLRSNHEVELLKAMRAAKQRQLDEANHNLAGLQKYQDVVTARQQYYLSRPFMNQFETLHLNLAGASLVPMGLQAGAEVLAAIMHLIPDTKAGAPTTMGVTYGGSNIASAIQSSGGAAGAAASILNTIGSLSATLGGYQRRQDDWTHQADQATKELQQVNQQIAAAEMRVAIAEQELANHDRQTENAKEVDEYLRSRKFTSQELYGWMAGKLSGLYFQGYQLAYDVAKRAERTFRYELGLRDSNFIQFGYWDSLKKGLLSGERLHHDLKRMDVAYLDQNRREYEITKHISLNAIDPVGLLKLKETGECFVSLPEVLFDLDYPGHYLRRIKSVSLTIPCVTGPYTGVNCTLTQYSSSIRHASTLLGDKYARNGADDSRFTDSFGTIESIVTSGGQNDAGLFETSLRDERYLPFEGQGVIGTWRIQLAAPFKSFDYQTISDVVLHMRYTAREGGELLRQHTSAELSAAVDQMIQAEGGQGMARAFSLRHEFPTEWFRFLNPPPDTNGDQSVKLDLSRERFPFVAQDRIKAIDSVELFVKVKPEYAESHNDSTLKLSLEPGVAKSPTALQLAEVAGLLRAEKSPGGALGPWTLTGWLDGTPHLRIGPEATQDIVLVCRYRCS